MPFNSVTFVIYHLSIINLSIYLDCYKHYIYINNIVINNILSSTVLYLTYKNNGYIDSINFEYNLDCD